jgi:hypothetical protein
VELMRHEQKVFEDICFINLPWLVLNIVLLEVYYIEYLQWNLDMPRIHENSKKWLL